MGAARCESPSDARITQPANRQVRDTLIDWVPGVLSGHLKGGQISGRCLQTEAPESPRGRGVEDVATQSPGTRMLGSFTRSRKRACRSRPRAAKGRVPGHMRHELARRSKPLRVLRMLARRCSRGQCKQAEYLRISSSRTTICPHQRYLDSRNRGRAHGAGGRQLRSGGAIPPATVTW